MDTSAATASRLKMFRRHRSSTDAEQIFSFRCTDNSLPIHVREKLQLLFGQIETEFAQMYQENLTLREKVDYLNEKLESMDGPVGDSTDGGGGGPGPSARKSSSAKKSGSQISQKIKSTYKTSTSRLANTFKNSASSSSVGTFVRRYTGHADGVWDLSYSSVFSQPLLASASADYTSKVWCPMSGCVVLEYYGHRGSVNSVRFHPSQDLVLTASGDHTAHVWRAQVPYGSMSSDGQRSSSDEDLGGSAAGDSGGELTPHTLTPASPTVSALPGGPLQMNGRTPNNVTNGSVGTNGGSSSPAPVVVHAPLTSFKGHTNVVSGAGWVASGSLLVTGSWDTTLLVHDVETGHVTKSLLGHDNEVTNVCTHPGHNLVLSSSKDSSIRLWDLRESQSQSAAVQVKGHAGTVNSVVFAPGDKIVSASEDRSVKVWDIKAMNTPYATLRTDSAVNRIDVSSQGLIAVPHDNRSIRLYDLQGNRWGRLSKRSRVGHTRMVCCATWADDSQSVPNLFSCGFDRLILGWQVAYKGTDGLANQRKGG